MTNETRRLFFGLSLPEPLKKLLTHLPFQLKELIKDNNFRWTPEENLHITVRFLGSVMPDDIHTYFKAVQDSLKQMRSFKLQTQQLIGLPNNNHPFLIAMGLNKSEALNKLYETVDKQLVCLGLSKEKHVYTPHITLIRKKNKEHQLQKLLKEKSLIEPFEFTVERLTLFESIPSKDKIGTFYKALENIEFKPSAF